MKSGSLNFLEPSRPAQACTGIPLLVTFISLLCDELWWLQETERKNFKSKMPFNEHFLLLKKSCPKSPIWRVMYSCNCDRKWTITSQQTFISGSNFDPTMPFGPLSWWYSELTYNELPQSRGQVVLLCSVMANIRSRLQEYTACQGDQLRYVIFKKYKANIKWYFAALVRNFLCFLYSTHLIHTAIWKPSNLLSHLNNKQQ